MPHDVGQGDGRLHIWQAHHLHLQLPWVQRSHESSSRIWQRRNHSIVDTLGDELINHDCIQVKESNKERKTSNAAVCKRVDFDPCDERPLNA